MKMKTAHSIKRPIKRIKRIKEIEYQFNILKIEALKLNQTTNKYEHKGNRTIEINLFY